MPDVTGRIALCANALQQEPTGNLIAEAVPENPELWVPWASRIVECVNAMEGVDDPEEFMRAMMSLVEFLRVLRWAPSQLKIAAVDDVLKHIKQEEV